MAKLLLQASSGERSAADSSDSQGGSRDLHDPHSQTGHAKRAALLTTPLQLALLPWQTRGLRQARGLAGSGHIRGAVSAT